MSPLIEKRLVSLLEVLVYDHVLPEGYYTDAKIKEFEVEKSFLLRQLRELDLDTAWWADSEWDWFISRTLDFLQDPVSTSSS